MAAASGNSPISVTLVFDNTPCYGATGVVPVADWRAPKMALKDWRETRLRRAIRVVEDGNVPYERTTEQ